MSGTLGELKAIFSADGSKFEKELNELQQQFIGLVKKVESSGNRLGHTMDGFDENLQMSSHKMQDSSQIIEKAFRDIQHEVNESIGKIGTYSHEMQAGMDRANEAVSQAQGVINHFNTTPIEDASHKGQSAIKSFSSEFMNGVQSSILPQLGAFYLASKAIETVGSAFVSSIQNANEFNQKFREISTITTSTQEQLNQMGDAVLKLSGALGTNAVELAAAQYEILSAGISDTSMALRTLESSGKLAKTGLSSVNEAADLLTSAMNAFGVGPEKSMDSLFKTVQDGKTTVSGLAQAFGQVAPLAQQLGVTLDELNAATAALTLSGQSASEAQTALRGAFSNIIKPTTDATKAAKDLGLEFNAIAIKNAGGLIPFLEQVRQKTGGNVEVMGRLFGSVEGLNGVLALTGARHKDLIKIQTDLQASSGSVDKEFKKQKSTLNDLGNNLNNIGIKLGRWTLDIIDPVLKALNSILEATLGLMSEIERIVGRVKSSIGSMNQGLQNMSSSINAGIQNLGKPSASLSGRRGSGTAKPGSYGPSTITAYASPWSTTGMETRDYDKLNDDLQKVTEKANAVGQSLVSVGTVGRRSFNDLSDVIRNMGFTLESSLMQATQTGKFAFHDFANSVIQDIIRIGLRMAEKSLFGQSGFFARLFNPSPAQTAISSPLLSSTGPLLPPAKLGSVQLGGAFASGGDPPVGIPSLVGERGPELFIPKTRGTILTANATRVALAGGGSGPVTVNHYFTIQALDATGMDAQLKAREGWFRRLAVESVQAAYNKRGQYGPMDRR